ncbi:hypothetical protein [Microbacterium sp. bgisy189]|uniref:hypothetical protein n=1 Tax=Microbacterium sp. bgisy189 TaxID=3413798 RepID=UPI003EBDF695
MGFKEPDDFARFLTIGAHAASAISRDLEQNHGHRIIELERYARANKIWQVKVKRMRLPDLMCLRCGRRFESKGKSALELKLSDSATPGREWWAGGMRQDDVFGFVRVAVQPNRVDVGQVVYVTREALHEAKDALVAGQRKSVADGSEIAVSWPSWTPTSGGIIDVLTDTEIVIEKSDGRRQTYRNHAKWPSQHPYLPQGAHFAAGDMVVSSVAPADVACAGDVWDWEADLASPDTDDRFAAVKAARWLNRGSADDALRVLALQSGADWRVAIEAAASLSPHEPSMVDVLLQHALSGAKEGAPMEAVFVLTELASNDAAEALEQIAADVTLASELRSAATWGLGLGAAGQPDRLIAFLDDHDDLVALHAGAVVPNPLTNWLKAELESWLTSTDLRRVASAAHLLARRGEIQTLVTHAQSAAGDNKALIIRALGDLERADVDPYLGGADHTTKSALWALWVRDVDWLRADDTDGGLEILEQQSLVL